MRENNLFPLLQPSFHALTYVVHITVHIDTFLMSFIFLTFKLQHLNYKNFLFSSWIRLFFHAPRVLSSVSYFSSCQSYIIFIYQNLLSFSTSTIFASVNSVIYQCGKLVRNGSREECLRLYIYIYIYVRGVFINKGESFNLADCITPLCAIFSVLCW